MKSDKNDVASALAACSQTAGDELAKSGKRMRSQLTLAAVIWMCGPAGAITVNAFALGHYSGLQVLLLANAGLLVTTLKMAKTFTDNYRRATEDHKYYAGLKHMVDTRALAYSILAKGGDQATLEAFAKQTLESIDRYLAAVNNPTHTSVPPSLTLTDAFKRIISVMLN